MHVSFFKPQKIGSQNQASIFGALKTRGDVAADFILAFPLIFPPLYSNRLLETS